MLYMSFAKKYKNTNKKLMHSYFLVFIESQVGFTKSLDM